MAGRMLFDEMGFRRTKYWRKCFCVLKAGRKLRFLMKQAPGEEDENVKNLQTYWMYRLTTGNLRKPKMSFQLR